jgi:hypothetical protein
MTVPRAGELGLTIMLLLESSGDKTICGCRLHDSTVHELVKKVQCRSAREWQGQQS